MKNIVKLDGLERQRMAMGIVAVEIFSIADAKRSLVPNHVGDRELFIDSLRVLPASVTARTME